MGCTISRMELRGRSTEAAGFKHKIVEDVSTRDSDKLLGRNSDSLEKKDFVLGEANELLVPQKQCFKDPYPKPDREGNDEEKEERGAVIPNFDGPLWMASPSFREYCVDGGDSDDDDGVKGIAVIAKAKGNNGPENKKDGENLAKYSNNIENTNEDKQNQSEGSAAPSVKRRRNLRQVLTMRRPAAVRNFFSVTTCYNPIPPSTHVGSRKSRG